MPMSNNGIWKGSCVRYDEGLYCTIAPMTLKSPTPLSIVGHPNSEAVGYNGIEFSKLNFLWGKTQNYECICN